MQKGPPLLFSSCSMNFFFFFFVTTFTAKSSPSSSKEQLFNILELVDFLVGYLNMTDMFPLLQTSRQLYQRCKPFVFSHLQSVDYEHFGPSRAIDIFGCWNRMHYPASQEPSVRSVYITEFNRAYLFNGFMAYQQSLQETDTMSTATAVPINSWLSPPNDISYPVISLAPMFNLTKLTIVMTPSSSDRRFSLFDPTYKNYTAIFS